MLVSPATVTRVSREDLDEHAPARVISRLRQIAKEILAQVASVDVDVFIKPGPPDEKLMGTHWLNV
jgi:hypothetical protein